jgi:hypothetical protein
MVSVTGSVNNPAAPPSTVIWVEYVPDARVEEFVVTVTSAGELGVTLSADTALVASQGTGAAPTVAVTVPPPELRTLNVPVASEAPSGPRMMLRFTAVALGGSAAEMLAMTVTVTEGTAVNGDTMVTCPVLVPEDSWLGSTLTLMDAGSEPAVEESKIQGALGVAVKARPGTDPAIDKGCEDVTDPPLEAANVSGPALALNVAGAPSISRIRLLRESAINMLPEPSITTPSGRAKDAVVASEPSPFNLSTPSPAMVLS